MVDAARQMLDELMGRNRNLHPSEALRKINWEDPDYCQFYNVKFCPHDLFINTRADLGPCTRIHDEEAKQMYEDARVSPRKRHYEDEFLRFCNVMLHDVDRKIQKGKQRLQLMHRDQPLPQLQHHVSKYQEQLNNLNARIKKLLSEAEEAGIRGDVDQAQDLMSLCDHLKEEKEMLVAQYENNASNKDVIPPERPAANSPKEASDATIGDSDGTAATIGDTSNANKDGSGNSSSGESDKKSLPNWTHDLGTLPEKQMEVCETCGAFLIVGDAQQRIEDHLMGKQHLGYSKLRKAVAEINEKRQREREDDERKRREDRAQRGNNYDGRREHREYRGHSRDQNSRHQPERHRPGHHKSHRRRSQSRSGNNRHHHRDSRDDYSRSRSRSRY